LDADHPENGVLIPRRNTLRAGALVIGVDAFFNSRSDQLAALAARHALPTISAYQEFTAAAAISCLGAFRPPKHVVRSSLPASENLHRSQERTHAVQQAA
jgi:hypothetical protein